MSVKRTNGVGLGRENPSFTKTDAPSSKTLGPKGKASIRDALDLGKSTPVIGKKGKSDPSERIESSHSKSALYSRSGPSAEEPSNKDVLDCPIEKANQARLESSKKMDLVKPIIHERENSSPSSADPELARIFAALHRQVDVSTVIFPRGRNAQTPNLKKK